MIHTRPARVRSLVLVDALALLAFVLVGVGRHHAGFTIVEVAKTAVPLLGAWFALSPFLRTYARPGWRTLALTWTLAIPAGVAVRALVRGQRWDVHLLTFLGVALVFTLLFLVVARLLALGLRRNR